MRVVAGTRGGRNLQTVPGRSTRPTADRVKEAMFNRLGPFFGGGIVLDLFAGTGSLGIEALSRGCERCVFIDQERQAIQVIRQNLETLDLVEQSEVYRNEAEKALRILIGRKRTFDLVLLDPPYAYRKVETLLAVCADHHLLAEGAQVMVEHDESLTLPDRVGLLRVANRSAYGGTALSLYELQSAHGIERIPLDDRGQRGTRQ